jgi:hypothetical protein
MAKASASVIISHILTDEAPNAYKHFDPRQKGWTKGGAQACQIAWSETTA